MSGEKRSRLSFLWWIVLAALAVAALYAMVLMMQPDLHWTWMGSPAGRSKSQAPELSFSQRIRGRIDTGQTLYVRVPFSARGRAEFELVGAGMFDVDTIDTSGKQTPIVQLEKPPYSEPTWIPAWLPFTPSWGQGGGLDDVAYFVFRPMPGANRGGAYELAVVNEGETVRP